MAHAVGVIVKVSTVQMMRKRAAAVDSLVSQSQGVRSRATSLVLIFIAAGQSVVCILQPLVC